MLNIKFVKLDCSVLKSSLVQHCSDWQTKLTQLLSHMATNHLKELHASLQDNVNRWGFKCFMCLLQTIKIGLCWIPHGLWKFRIYRWLVERRKIIMRGKCIWCFYCLFCGYHCIMSSSNTDCIKQFRPADWFHIKQEQYLTKGVTWHSVLHNQIKVWVCVCLLV